MRLPFSKIGLPLVRFLAAAGIGTLASEPDGKDNLRTLAMWESARARGIQLFEFRFFDRPGSNLFIAGKNGSLRVFEGLPRPERIGSKGLDWMDNKSAIKRVFQEAGIPVARGGTARSWKEARSIFLGISKPVIVKPNIGSRSRHTHLHINNEEELRAGFSSAQKLSPWVIVEEELEGTIFRPTLVGGKLVAVARKDAPRVVGDGRRSVRELIESENKNPKRQGPIFHRIKIDDDLCAELERQKLGLQSVPDPAQAVLLGQKTGRGSGGSVTDVTSETHPENVMLFEKIAAVVGDSLVGVDFAIEDIGRSWREQPRCGTLECNSLPFLDVHHYPLFGEPKDVAGMLWDLVFPA